jgi:hypothetical protein
MRANDGKRGRWVVIGLIAGSLLIAAAAALWYRSSLPVRQSGQHLGQ